MKIYVTTGRCNYTTFFTLMGIDCMLLLFDVDQIFIYSYTSVLMMKNIDNSDVALFYQ